jgi:hypothetical protein
MFAAARPRNIDLRPTARTDIALRSQVSWWRIWAWSYLPRAASIVHERVFQRENFERTVMNRRRFLTATALGAGARTSSVAIAGHWSVDAP